MSVVGSGMDVRATSKADHYRALADRMRAEAGETADARIRTTLLDIASRYATLAAWMERRREADASD
jgi:hypothetical protein